MQIGKWKASHVSLFCKRWSGSSSHHTGMFIWAEPSYWGTEVARIKMTWALKVISNPSLFTLLSSPPLSVCLWLCPATEWALPQRTRLSWHSAKLSLFHVRSSLPSLHPQALLVSSLQFGLSHSRVIGSLFIFCPALSPKPSFPLWLQWALLLYSASFVCLGSRVLLIGAERSQLRLLSLKSFSKF